VYTGKKHTQNFVSACMNMHFFTYLKMA